jgi:type I restriction enzyme S subunit
MNMGWKKSPLGELCEYQRGLTYSKGDEVDHSDNVVLRATNIDLATNLLKFDELRYINDKVVVPASKKIKKGSLLVCTASGSKSHLGKVAFIDGDYGYAFGGFMGMITPKSVLLPKYLFHAMTSNVYKEFIGELSDGANINNLKFDDLSKFLVSYPPLPEQNRIVAILDEAFEGIATAKANAEKNLQNARAIFESHVQSLITCGGANWVERLLGDVCDLFQGLCINAKTKHLLVKRSNLPLLRIKDLRSNSAEQFVAETGWPKNAQVCESDLIYTRTGQIGLVFRGRSGVLHNNCFKVKPRPVLDNDYMFWWLQSPGFRAHITTLASKAAQPDITHALFKAQPILVPPLDYQHDAVIRIDRIGSETRRLVAIYEQKCEALEALKKSLLHSAFSGELIANRSADHMVSAA